MITNIIIWGLSFLITGVCIYFWNQMPDKSDIAMKADLGEEMYNKIKRNRIKND